MQAFTSAYQFPDTHSKFHKTILKGLLWALNRMYATMPGKNTPISLWNFLLLLLQVTHSAGRPSPLIFFLIGIDSYLNKKNMNTNDLVLGQQTFQRLSAQTVAPNPLTYCKVSTLQLSLSAVVLGRCWVTWLAC